MNIDRETPQNLATLRQRLAAAQGKHYWRCLEELAKDASFQELVQAEFPQPASAWIDPVSRRRFLKLMGASLALAGLTGCTSAPAEKILPYVRQPEGMVPGKPLFFATAMTLGGLATGVLVESHEGRPTKIEGNPDHPASLGATDAFAQASILTLYDPDRSQTVTYRGRISTWDEALTALRGELERRGRKLRLRILTETVTSPTLVDQLAALLARFPAARWYQYEPMDSHHARQGAVLAFGEAVNTIYRIWEKVDDRLEKAEVILSLDSDFLGGGPGHLRYVRQFTEGRRVRAQAPAMNRLYVIESSPSLTGAAADHRLALRAGEIAAFARAIADAVHAQLRAQSPDADTLRALEGLPAAPASASHAAWIAALARDLAKHPGRSLVLAGESQPPVVHVLAHALNRALGNVGKTVVYTAPVEAAVDVRVAERAHSGFGSLAQLTAEMERGEVDLLVILGGNPVFTAPADVAFRDQLDKVPLRLHLSLYDDETSAHCHWHIPEAHYLEAWSDARAFDGTVSIVQPLIAPLYGGKSAHQLLAVFTDQPDRSDRDVVRGFWQRRHQGSDFEPFWRQSLHQGVVTGSAAAFKNTLSWKMDWTKTPFESKPLENLEIIFRPDPAIYDGRFANNGWLQELPRPLTRLTWDNVALMSPRTAQELGFGTQIARTGGEHGDILVDVAELHYRDRPAVTAPVWIQPGHPDNAVTVLFGQGRTRAGKVGNRTGFNAYPLRTAQAPWFDSGLRVVPTGGPRYPLACTQYHHLMENRDLVQATTLDKVKRQGLSLETPTEPGQRRPLTLYRPEEFPYTGYKWGMAIDLTACIGCGACVVACQAENNIPVVGKSEVLRGREMHWLRIDRYYDGPGDQPQHTYFQPVPCMHCENAPCEEVCPVGATVHSADGLNDMVYNRCVGTRYCSNNCPYKVRRFNFFAYADYARNSLNLLHNPEVTVRSRGVMEKCTYCVQRIRAAEIEAKRQDRQDPRRPGVAPVYDGELLTACQAACPAQAIVFGDMNDPKSQVARLKAEPLEYGLLAELNTRPRTTYLAAVRNPNPEIETG